MAPAFKKESQAVGGVDMVIDYEDPETRTRWDFRSENVMVDVMQNNICGYPIGSCSSPKSSLPERLALAGSTQPQ